MRIKTYTADSVPRALAMIKKELGEGAVILNTRRTRKRRLFGLAPAMAYEITAASEPPADLPVDEVSEVAKEATRTENPGDVPLDQLETYEVADTPPRPTPVAAGRRADGKSQAVESTLRGSQDGPVWTEGLNRLSMEIAELKRLVSRQPAFPAGNLLYLGSEQSEQFQKLIWHQESGTVDWHRANAVSTEFQRLIGNGVEETLALLLMRKVVGKLPAGEDVRDRLRLRLNMSIESMVKVSPIEASHSGGRSIFLGPTGVGKTTSIAKLAAHFSLREGRKVQLITLDTFRIAAAEQLKTFGEIIGVPVRVVNSVSELKDALDRVSGGALALVDTTGLSHRRVGDFSELAEYLQESDSIEKHLVLSTTTRESDLRDTIEAFQIFAPDKLIFTKIDESSGYGSILNEVLRVDKPLSYLTNGQRVPEDLIVPTAKTVADLIVPIYQS